MTEIVEYSETEAALSVLRDKYKRKYEVTTTAGMSEARQARAEIKKYRTSLEEKRKELKAPALERCRVIDAEAKRITAELLALEEPIDDTIKAEERRKEEEKARAEREALERRAAADKLCLEIRGVAVLMVGRSSSSIKDQIARVKAVVPPVNEYTELIATARGETVAQLEHLHASTIEREESDRLMAEERAELDRLRAKAAADDAKAKADREAADRAAQAARDAADKAAAEERAREAARINAERAKLEAERQAEQERQAAARAAEEAKARAEREAAEAKAKKEREAAEAIERERVRKLDARSMLVEFVRRYGELAEFAEVVAAIEALPPASETPKKKGK